MDPIPAFSRILATTRMKMFAASNTGAGARLSILFILLLCVFGVTADYPSSDHGRMNHPRNFKPEVAKRWSKGNYYRGTRGRAFSGWHSTWYGGLQKRFDAVTIAPNGDINTLEFIAAVNSLNGWFDFTGVSAFQPAKTDNAANVAKIQNRYNANSASSGTLQSLVRNEKGKVAYSGSAAEALMWLVRSVDFTAQALRADIEENRGLTTDNASPRMQLSDALKNSYQASLSQYHNALTRTAVNGAILVSPTRKTFYQKLANADTPANALGDTDKWIAALEDRIAVLELFLDTSDAKW